MVLPFDDYSKRYYWVLALAAIIPRFLFIFFASESVGDGKAYETAAENILSGCGVSLSPIGSGECVPHFGGNQGPGYPAFIAFFWWVSGHSDLIVHLAQGIFYVIALIYLIDAVRLYTSSSKLALLTGLLLAFSPLQVAWPRFIFTETLALAGTLWVFAELLRSLHESKLRIVPIAFALIAATFIRLDGILLAIPVAATGLIIHRPLDAIRRGLVIALILGLPWGGWILRNAHVGLTNIFAPPVLCITDERNRGFCAWGKTWLTNQYQFAAMQWTAATYSYDAIRIDESVYRTKKEKETVRALLDELKKYSGEPFPTHVDDQFASLAEERIKAEPLTYFLFNPVKRIWALWSNLNDSFAWPIGFGGLLSPQDRLDIVKGGIRSKLLLLKKYPVQTIGKIFVNGWKVILYFLFMVAAVVVYKKKEAKYRDVMTLALSFVIARSIFSGLLGHVETRYILMQMPIFEFVVVLVIASEIIQRRSRNSHDPQI